MLIHIVKIHSLKNNKHNIFHIIKIKDYVLNKNNSNMITEGAFDAWSVRNTANMIPTKLESIL